MKVMDDGSRRLRLHRIFGRFRYLRTTLAKHRKRRDLAFVTMGGSVRIVDALAANDKTQIADCVRALGDLGFYSGLQLPAETVEKITRLARATPCRRLPDDDERFLIDEVRDGRTPGGNPVPIADVDLPKPCTELDIVGRDPVIIEIVRRYLGYRPGVASPRLFWSVSCDLPADVRRANGQTIDFHYDIDPGTSLYVYFYINGADKSSGSHVVLPRSHAKKPLSMLLSSSFPNEAKIAKTFGAVDQVTIEGGPGYGFAEDPTCLHKATIPITGDRLVLQYRYW